MSHFTCKEFSRPTAYSLSVIRLKIAARAVREWLVFDSAVTRTVAALTGTTIGFVLLILGRSQRAVDIFARIHRGNFHPISNKLVQRMFGEAISRKGGSVSRRLEMVLAGYPASVEPMMQTARFFENPERLLDGCCLVLKASSANERGVLYLYYSYVYPLFLRYFDAGAIEKRYHIVIEPSWSGYCDLNILCLTRLEKNVFVGAMEPRDADFVNSLGATNLVVVDIGGNTWIDPQLFKPSDNVPKDIDIIYVASWAHYKRHWALFKALSTLKTWGLRPRVALVGYPGGLSAKDISDQASALNVEDLVEFHERVAPARVNELLNRSKVNLMWSRREGSPRAIIEGMAAGVPCIIRTGFNYGYRYPYINQETGCFATEHELPTALAHMLERHSTFSPRSAVIPRMTPEASTRRLNDAIRTTALSNGETWTTDITVRVGTVDGLGYRDAEDRKRFDADYAFLRSSVINR